MKCAKSTFAFVVAICWVVGCDGDQTGILYRAPAITNVIDNVVFEEGNWEPHLAAGSEGSSWGNHRAVVVLDSAVGDAVFVTVPWRRRDLNPEAKSVVVLDASTNMPVNSIALRIENVSGDIVFEPNIGSYTYHVYYLPWISTGGHYPQISYPTAMFPANPAWESRVRATETSRFPRGRITHIQSVNDFHSFFPMEVIATPEETETLLTETGGWAAVAEHRDFPVRMSHFIPFYWTQRDSLASLKSRALRGEYFTYQVAIVAGDSALETVDVRFKGFPKDLVGSLTCFNCEGTDENGERFSKTVSVSPGTVQPIWIGLRVPEDYPPGLITGTVIVQPAGRSGKAVMVRIDVRPEHAPNAGFGDPDLMTRLAWLNSTVGTDPDFLIEPFQSVAIDGHTLTILGRGIELGDNGLPAHLLSYFTPEMTHLAEAPESVLAEPIDLQVMINGQPEKLRSDAFSVQQSARGEAHWQVTRRSDRIGMQVEGRLEYDGMLDYRISVTALRDIDVADIKLPIALEPDAATYLLGLGFRGGKRPVSVDWRWKIENHQEGVWLGAVHKGLQYVLRDDGYVRPLNTNFYQNQPLRLPESWFNGGRGGIRIDSDSDAIRALNYSGPRRMAAGDTLQFNVRFLLTPFKTIETGKHFRTRFVHRYVPVDSVVAWGGTVVNIHHANEINPYINYPFFNLDQQSAYIEEAHAKGIKVKLYDTIRELTYKAHELFALRSLGDEILNDGEGGGHSWMQEHLETDYHAAWHAWRVDDAAILNKGTSRWTNYYIEGLAWLAANQHIDGLYLDDIAFSRETVKRMISVLHQHRDEVIIDLHSANQFNPRDGHINSAMLYMEHFPFISRLWFGEYFDYDSDADYWMTEVSGIPFGLMGEMLQDGGHPYRGMLYGMTTRVYGSVDPRPVWEMMNAFRIDESAMIGYWVDDAPVTTDHPQILATTYVRPDGLLIALASWSPDDVIVRLAVDTEVTSGLAKVRVMAPAVQGLQEAQEVDLSRVVVPANQGLFILIESGGSF